MARDWDKQINLIIIMGKAGRRGGVAGSLHQTPQLWRRSYPLRNGMLISEGQAKENTADKACSLPAADRTRSTSIATT